MTIISEPKFFDSLRDKYKSEPTEVLQRNICLIKQAMQNPRKMAFDGADGLPTFSEKIDMINSILAERNAQ